MTWNSVARAAADNDLQIRIQACANKAAHDVAALKDTEFAKAILSGYANYTSLYWGVASDVGNAYEQGIIDGRGSPGHDVDVVTDQQIQQAVLANWPPNQSTTPNPTQGT